MSGKELAEARENDEREWREDGAARALAGDLGRPERCQEPHSVWGVCGLPEEVHDDAFTWAKGTRFYHEFWTGTNRR